MKSLDAVIQSPPLVIREMCRCFRGRGFRMPTSSALPGAGTRIPRNRRHSPG